MKILIACEESQRVCTAFRELGHEAYSCDIQECSGGHPEWHIHGDVSVYFIDYSPTDNIMKSVYTHTTFSKENECQNKINGFLMSAIVSAYENDAEKSV